MSNPRYGKGDTPRPVDKAKWSENYDRIFRKPPPSRKTRAYTDRVRAKSR